jgi:hypothetical protein
MKTSLTITETQEETGLGRTFIYAAIKSGQLDARKAGSRTVVTGASVKHFIESLPKMRVRDGKAA